MSANKENKIDFVLSWVDGNDPEWQERMYKYKGVTGDSRVSKFRDMGTLKYWFRAVEKYAPWVNNIFFVTCGQCPEWLNKDHPKLKLINHEDYIPEEYLPTFSSTTIEMNFHRIKELSEQFVYFNDDMFILAPTKADDFFKNGHSRNCVVMDYFVPNGEPWYLKPVLNASIINKHFKKKKFIKENIFKMLSPKNGIYVIKNLQFLIGEKIPGFAAFHLPNSLMKSALATIWEKEPKLLNDTCMPKFREPIGVNQWLVKDWQTCMGLDIPRSINFAHCYHFYNQNDLDKTVNAIKKQKYKLLCINDHFEDFETSMTQIQNAFEYLYPEKSSFEL